MSGYFGAILRVNLTEKQFRIEQPDKSLYEKYFGGKGLASYLLYELNPPGVNALDPGNCLILATGPATGSPIWGGSRYGVYTKSPQTGFYSESYSGGRVPEAIASTGFDAIVIQGQSAGPLVLEIHPDQVLFHEAADLWGLETYAIEEEAIKRFSRNDRGYKKAGTIVIGPAAENLVCFSTINNDFGHQAGRTGVGAVLGAKKLKAIVFQGDRVRSLFDLAAAQALAKRIASDAKGNPGVLGYKTFGTPQLVKVTNNNNCFPTRYWSEGRYDQWEQISAEALNSQCEVKPTACLKCFMACGRHTTVKSGRHAGLTCEGPEYETIYAFGGLCLIDSIEEILYLNDICDRLGLDTITAGNLCAFTVEAFKRGKIDFPVDYGQVDVFAKLLSMIARRQGIGDTLARGIVWAAREWGLEDIAVHVKGLEPAGYDPRVLKGMGLAYATSDRGACHLRATFYKPELTRMIPPDQIEGKAALFIEFEDRLTIFDTLVLCRFFRDLYPWETLGEIIHVLTGLPGDKEFLQERAAAISTLIRRFNIREGLTREDDWLSPGFFKKMAKTGFEIKPEELKHMLDDYYRLRGWDEKGVPR